MKLGIEECVMLIRKKEAKETIGFGLVLWHINHSRLSNAELILNTYKQFYFKQFSLA